VMYDGVLNTTGWSWVGTTDKTIAFSPTVPNAVEITVLRKTAISEIRHSFVGGAAFTYQTVDEDLKQVLHIAQEARENSSIADVFQDLDIHGYKLLNVGVATEPGDAVSFGQFSAHDATVLGYVTAASTFATAAEESAIDAAASAVAAASVVGSLIGVTVQAYDVDTAKTDVKQVYTAQQGPMRGTLTDAASIAWNADTNGQVVRLLMTLAVGATRAMAAPTNIVQDNSYMLRVQQDAIGNRALTYNAAFKFGTNGPPVLTSTANKVDWLSFIGGVGNTLEYTGCRLDAV